MSGIGRAAKSPTRSGAGSGARAPAAIAQALAGSRLDQVAQMIAASPVMRARAAAIRGAFGAALDPAARQKPAPEGLPGALKAAIEARAGLSMDDVRVHRDSPRPAQLQARAYAQGDDIDLAPGEESLLPHEAWHVVQQKQGRVAPTTRLNGVAINADGALEREAETTGARLVREPAPRERSPAGGAARPVAQRVVVKGEDITLEKIAQETKDATLNSWLILLKDEKGEEIGTLREAIAKRLAALAPATQDAPAKRAEKPADLPPQKPSFGLGAFLSGLFSGPAQSPKPAPAPKPTVRVSRYLGKVLIQGVALKVAVNDDGKDKITIVDLTHDRPWPNRVSGELLYRLEKTTDGPILWLKHFEAEPTQLGLGALMMAEFALFAKTIGCKLIKVETPALTAMEGYKAFGGAPFDKEAYEKFKAYLKSSKYDDSDQYGKFIEPEAHDAARYKVLREAFFDPKIVVKSPFDRGA